MRLVLVSFSFFLPSFLFYFLFYFIFILFFGGGGLIQNLAWGAVSIPCMPLQLQQAIWQVSVCMFSVIDILETFRS